VTTPDQLRDIIRYLQHRVTLVSADPRSIQFDPPEIDQATIAGLDGETIQSLMDAEWWPEMVDDIIETPDFAEPDESAEQVLQYAKDVVQEYIRKRFSVAE